MTATVHGLVGAAIATKIVDPTISFPIAFASHFLLDKIPHWDAMTNKADKSHQRILIESAADYVISYILIWLIFGLLLHSPNLPYLFAVAFVSQLPDYLEAPYIITKKQVPVSYQIYRVQKWFHDFAFNARLKAPWGVVTQIAVIALFLFWSVSK